MKDPTLRQLQEISALLNSSLDHATIRKRAIEAATLLMNAEAGSLLLLEESHRRIVFRCGPWREGRGCTPGSSPAWARYCRTRRSNRKAYYRQRCPARCPFLPPCGPNQRIRHAQYGLCARHGAWPPSGGAPSHQPQEWGLFGEDDLHNFVALGHQVGIAIENANLYEEIHLLFEGFISASVQAIESRDPTTSGHSQRVATLTCRLADAVSHTDSGLYAGVRFNEEQLKEIRYAAVLHDFGKVGVREHILLKARKLYPLQQELIKSRFDFIKRTLEVDTLHRKLEVHEAKMKGKKQTLLVQLDRQLAQQTKEVDELFSFILKCNQPSPQSTAEVVKLKEIAQLEYRSYDGPRPFLTEEEVGALSVLQGTLTQSERKEIEWHVAHTFEFLSKIPWSRSLKNVPSIAWSHHEKLDGSGYPRGLLHNQIPLQARMMTICDIYDALTASDRPYKAAISSDIALSYLEGQSKEGKLDSELVDVFTKEKVYQVTQPRSKIRKIA